jgi:hypothetical protein
VCVVCVCVWGGCFNLTNHAKKHKQVCGGLFQPLPLPPREKTKAGLRYSIARMWQFRNVALT